MTPTSVGMRCPECSRDRTKVRTMRSLPGAPSVTQALIVINVVAFLVETASGASLGGGGGGSVWTHGVLFGPAVTAHNPCAPTSILGCVYTGTHEYWRLVTGGFLHDGFFHILINMVSLYFVGQALEPAVGRVNFIAVYLASLLAGSFGALVFQPQVPTVGASGAIFGIFGALIVYARSRGISLWQSGLGFILLINVLLTVGYKGISFGGHLGGFLGGLITGALVIEIGERRRMRGLALAGCAAVAVVSVVGAIAVAGQTGLAPNGI
jgi:membrane associated rhomboid family serine protease